MKTLFLFHKIGLFAFLFSGIISISSCKKEKHESAAPIEYGTLKLHLHTNADVNSEIDYNTIYTMTGGRKISVTKAQLYISGIQLVKTDGTIITVPGLTLLKIQEEESYLVGSVPAGNYQTIKFNVGLSPEMNDSAPTPSDTLLNRPDMWLGNTAQPEGYVFVYFQGSIDTTSSANGTNTQMQPFTYKIGTNTNLKMASIPIKNYMVVANKAEYLHIVIDYNKLLDGIPLNVSSNLNMTTASANVSLLGTKLANNIPLMFSNYY